jgi:alkylation response protein AidB-like acyl-CoA dehydrogenase
LLLLLVSSAICGEVISAYGTAQQRARWLPRLAAGDGNSPSSSTTSGSTPTGSSVPIDAAIQCHGGNGVSTEYGLIPLWGLARLLRIAPVNREMILNYVAQHSLGLPRSY